MKLWTALLLALPLSSSVVAQSEKPKLGVVLSLSGTMAISEAVKVEQLRSKFKGFELVVMDAASRPGNAAKLVQQLQTEDKVAGILLGTLSLNDIQEIGQSRPKVPVISLTPTANPATARQATEFQITSFVQPDSQLRALRSGLPRNEKFFVATTPLYSAAPNVYGELLRSQTVDTATITGIDTRGAVDQSKTKNAVFAAVSGPDFSSRILADMKATNTRGFVIAPPGPDRVTGIVADLSRQWLASGTLTQTSWNQVKARSAYFEKSTGALAVGWELSTRSFDFGGLAAGAGESTCRCKSKDGVVSHTILCTTPPEKCQTRVFDDDCICKCATN